MQDAKQSLDGLYITLRGVPPEHVVIDWNDAYAAKFKRAMDDDFDSHGAITVLFELSREANKTKSGRLSGLLKALGGLLGLLQNAGHLQGDVTIALTGQSITTSLGTLGATVSATTTNYTPERIDQLIAERLAARQAKDFSRSDAIRKQLADTGVILEDGPQGTTWRRA